MASDARALKKLLAEVGRLPGWRVRHCGRAPHHTIFPPDGQPLIMVPRSPSDYRWRKNLRGQLRRAGWTGTLLD